MANVFYQIALQELDGDGLQVLPSIDDQRLAVETASRLRSFLGSHKVMLVKNIEFSGKETDADGCPLNYKCETTEVDFI